MVAGPSRKFDFDIRDELNPSPTGEINCDYVNKTGNEFEVENGQAFRLGTGGIREEIYEEAELNELAEAMTSEFCQGKDYKIIRRDSRLTLVEEKKPRETAPAKEAVEAGKAWVRKGVAGAVEGYKNLQETEEDREAKTRKAEEAKENRRNELEGDASVVQAAVILRRAKEQDESKDSVLEEFSYWSGLMDDPEKYYNDALELLALRGVVLSPEREKERGKNLKKRKAKEFAIEKGLVRLVQTLRSRGMSNKGIRVKIGEEYSDGGALLEEACNYAFERAGSRKKEKIWNVAKAHVPFTEESAWDKMLIHAGSVQKIRKLREVDKMEDSVIEPKIRADLGDQARLDELIEYAFAQADSKRFRKKSAAQFVQEAGLGDRVREWEEAHIKHEEINKRLKAKIDGDRAPSEIEEIIAAAFEGSITKTEKLVKAAEDAYEWQKDPGRGEKIKNILKGTALVGAGLAVGAGFLVYGAGWLSWETLKLLGRGAKKIPPLLSAAGRGVGKVLGGAARLTGNVLKHVVTEGPNVVKAAAKTVIVNPIKAAGRIISSPFVRAYQGFNWGRKYPAPASKVHVDKWWKKPYQWARNGISSLAYRGKQATLATALGLGLMVYGAGEGITNAVSQDLIGTQWHAPELTLFSSAPTHAAPHAEAGHGAGHPPDDHAHGAHAAPAHH